MTFSTFVTPTRDSDTWIAGADAWTSGNRETGLRSIDSGGYRADGDPRGRETNPREPTAAARGREQLAIGLLFGLGLLLGLAVAPVIADYAKADPSALWQAAAATAAFVAGCGAYGYATRRDLSSWARTLFWALLALIAFAIVAIFVSIPNSHIIYAIAGLAIFGALTIFDFNRLRRTTADGAAVIAASIFLDVFNVFLFFLQLFGGQRD